MHAIILTHYFPPIGGPGARRMLGWARGFDAAGCRVTVVTPAAHERDPYYQPDESYEGPATVLTPSILDPARFARGGEKPSVVADQSGRTGERRGMAARLRPYLLLPDHRRLANGPLEHAARGAIRPGEPTFVFTSSPYNSVHLAGAGLKKRFGDRVAWVADFRDDWFHPVFFPFPNALYRACNRRLEERVLRNADGLTVVSRSTLERIRGRHADRFGDAFWRQEGDSKWRWMPNGFDRTGVEQILESPLPVHDTAQPVQLHFSGTLWQGHSVDPLIAALDAVAERTGSRFRFELAGRVIEPIKPSYSGDRVEVVTAGWKPYEDALAATRAADLLLVHTGPESQDIKIKVFDAAAVRRPVLVLGPGESATVRLVREHVPDALVADQSDQSSIEACVERFLASSDRSQHAFDGVPEEYDRLKQAARLLDWASTLRPE